MSNFTLVHKTTESPMTLVLYNYQSGNFLSIFSGFYISNASGSTFSDYGIKSVHKGTENLSTIIMSRNNYLGTGRDVSYSAILYNYYRMTTISSYSASSLWEMNPQTLVNLATDEYI